MSEENNDFLKIINIEDRVKMDEILHNEIVNNILIGDSTVLFEIISQLDNSIVYNSLSDEGQKTIKKILI